VFAERSDVAEEVAALDRRRSAVRRELRHPGRHRRGVFPAEGRRL
jgi:hypothetical protein